MFTNWLTSEVPKSQVVSNPPPDMIVEVGPPPFARFPAHSTILSSQSGFFRAAISREVGKLTENPVYLPNITVDHFTPLLTYMYTGYLELNFENIFGVLLATHLLHMPRALEICRDYLAHSQRQVMDCRVTCGSSNDDLIEGKDTWARKPDFSSWTAVSGIISIPRNA